MSFYFVGHNISKTIKIVGFSQIVVSYKDFRISILMWLRRTKSTARIHSAKFSCSSFKDIQTLCTSGDDFNNLKRSSYVFHRVYKVNNSALRAFSLINPLLPELKSNHASSRKDSLSPTAVLSSFPETEAQSKTLISLPGAEKRGVVVYFTSLRVIHSTFEDCMAVRSILRGFRVLIDERDVSMDSSFMEELQRILLDHPEKKAELALPRVFIGGRYIGGAEDIRRLNESGQLNKYVEGLPSAKPGTCEACWGYRFILCDKCSGSHRCYIEKIGGFKTCTSCNENGLIRCSSCSCAPF